MGEKKRRDKAARSEPSDPSTFEGLIIFSPKTEPPWLERDEGGRYCKVLSLELLHSQQATCILCDEVLDGPAIVGIIVANKGHSIGAFGVCAECAIDVKLAEAGIAAWLAANFGDPQLLKSPMAARWFRKHAN
jgi:hypothetical protein